MRALLEQVMQALAETFGFLACTVGVCAVVWIVGIAMGAAP